MEQRGGGRDYKFLELAAGREKEGEGMRGMFSSQQKRRDSPSYEHFHRISSLRPPRSNLRPHPICLISVEMQKEGAGHLDVLVRGLVNFVSVN